MKYFTPERYSAIQTEDDVLNEKADADWEEQLRLYEVRLKEIDGKLPESVKKFMKTCHLHDADCDWWSFTIGHPHQVQLVVRQRDWGDHKFVCVLRYKMAFPGCISEITGDYKASADQFIHDGAGFYRPRVFDPENKPKPVTSTWLYDEWDYVGTSEKTVLGKHDIFSHSMLLSNGVEFRFLFTEFEFMFIPIGEGFVES